MNTCYNPFSLKEKTILVTGASSGIGRAIATECAQMGARVILCGRNVERLQETRDLLIGEGHLIIDGDLTNQNTIDKIVSKTQKLNGLVLCAGIANTTLVPFATKDKVSKVFEINLFSQIELFRVLLKKKLINNEASVVAICSIGGIKGFSIGNGIYGASKAALQSWMKTSSKELGVKRIRVNCICPGMVETPLIHGGSITEEQYNEDKKHYPLGRYGTPKDIAYGAIYLLSDASAWVTGTSLIIDGGLTN